MKRKTVTVEVNTKGRYDTTLSMTLMSIVNQSMLPDEIILVDDNHPSERIDLRESDIYAKILRLFDLKGIKWRVIFGDGVGIASNHQKVLDLVETDYVWRIDDDEYAEYDVLEKIYNTVIKGYGAVGCKIHIPYHILEYKESDYYNKVDVNSNYDVTTAIEWTTFTKDVDAEHLFSSFIYDVEKARDSGGYVTDLTVVGHKEETLFTYRMYKHEYKLRVISNAKIWHFHTSGGVRTYDSEKLFTICDDIAFNYFKLWNDISLKNKQVVILDGGIGDNYGFKMILKDLLKKKNVILFTHYPDVFTNIKSKKFEVYDMDIAKGVGFNFSKYNIYRYMQEEKWKGNVVDAYKKMYNV